MITAVGFGLGPLVGELIAQFSATPLFTPYIPIIVGQCLCFVGLLRLPQPEFSAQAFSIAPHLERPEAQFHVEFYITGLTAFCAFAAFSLFAFTFSLICTVHHSLAWSFGQWISHYLYFANFCHGTVFFQIDSCKKMPELWAVYAVVQFIDPGFMYLLYTGAFCFLSVMYWLALGMD